ncbi:cytochrome P450 [Streptomyces sp. NPDC088253]|uniref:cytochrome P450 n=1 Tax=Streptomyces sp. NPDC088253 TaxID=3365846 RepID=UPI0038211274
MTELADAAWKYLTDPHSRGAGNSELYRRLPVEAPVLRFGPVWIVSRFDLVTALASDPRCVIELPEQSEAMWAASPAFGEVFKRSMSVRPSADHRRLRRLVSAEFGARTVQQLRPRIDGIVDRLLAGPLERGVCEFVSEIGVPLPVMATAAMLDLPEQDWPRILDWAQMLTAQLAGATGGMEQSGPAPAAEEQLQEALRYVEDLVARRSADPGDDLISRLARQSGDEGRLTHDELVSMVILLFMTGLETMTSGLVNAILCLLQDPESWQRVVEDPELAGTAFAEGIRVLSPVPLGSRLVEEDIQLGEHRIRAGHTVILMYGAANLDPAQFPDPERFDLERRSIGQLAFGHGPYFCLGAAVSLLEGESVLRKLAALAPGMSLAGDSLRWRADLAFNSLVELPVRLAGRADAVQNPDHHEVRL